ncbi:MAG: extracellular solute-binding protein [Bacilli bacterium]|nr:extracellular solute-binding protein [Bacilli bacterium]
MLKVRFLFSCTLIFFIFLVIILYCFCETKDEFIYIKVLNSDDYIYLQKNKSDPKDLVLQFEEEYNKNINYGEKKIKVIYDTYDTPENAFNILSKGNVLYDLVCVSEYIVQKMANMGLLEQVDKKKVPNYFDYNNENHCSTFIEKQLKNIILNNKKTLFDYSLCYMWGTLGFIINLSHYFFKKNNMIFNEVINDIHDLDTIFESDKYNNAVTVKNSVRDLYAIGAIKTFNKEIQKAKSTREKNSIFNRGNSEDVNAKKHILEVYNSLLKFKKNIRGFEIDNGKEDIVNNKIPICLTWSGDALYSIQKAKKEKKIDLIYSIPFQGTNMWFDNWVIPKKSNKELAYKFLNFIFNHKHVIENMQYTGFTSSIIGKDIFNFFKNKYEKKDGDYLYDVTYFFKKDENDVKKYEINIFEKDRHNLISAQFVEENDINNLMIMRDFEKNNELLMDMFNEFKNDNLPIHGFILFFFEIFIFLFFLIKNKFKNKTHFMIK